MTECKGIIGKWLGHDYEAVYDEETPADVVSKVTKDGMVASWDMQNVLSSLTKLTYQGHVCTRCGDRVRRIERI